MSGPDHERFRARVDESVLVLFALVTEALGRGTAALLDQDVELANRVIAEDRDIDDRCQRLIGMVTEALSAPTGEPGELENLVAILQIVPELERSADLAEHIARRSLQGLGGLMTPRSRGLIQSMSDVAVDMWQIAGKAYEQRSRDAAFQLAEADDALDELSAHLVGSAIVQGSEPGVAADLALLARFYERLGDHAVNLARRIDSMAAPRRLSPVATVDVGLERGSRPQRAGSGRRGMAGLWARVKRIRLVPTDQRFFELFREAAINARDCAEELSKLMVSFNDLDERYKRIKAFERRGDHLTIELHRRLDTSFVTPFDREDVHALTEELDDVVDDMFSAASLIHLVRADAPLPEMAQLAEVLVAMADEMVELMDCLQSHEGARFRLQRIEHLERQGDVIFRHSMERLFSGEYDALEVLKWKDVVQALEGSLNAIEGVSDVVESILVKSS